jgi:5'-methylthioadenosine phosphorylase
MALVTDYDCWHEEEADVTTEAVLEILRKNAETAKEVIRKTVEILAAEPRGDCFCGTVLDDAFISDIATLPEDLYKELEPILRRVSAGRRNSG